jgi:hypothetical protein
MLRRILSAAIPVALWVSGADIAVLRQGVLFLAPFFLLLALWTAGVDPEPLLKRIRRSAPPRAIRLIRLPVRRGLLSVQRRGGLLIASSLSGRGPPQAASLAVC